MTRVLLMKSIRRHAPVTVLAALTLMSAHPASAQGYDPFQPGYDFGTARASRGDRFFRLGALAGFSLGAEFSVGSRFDISRSQPGPAGVSGELADGE